MIWLLAGTDQYRIQNKLNAIIGSEKDNVITFENAFDIQKIISLCQTLPFFATRQILVLNRFLKEKDKDAQKTIKEFLQKVPDFTDLIFIEEDTDERNALLKEIRKTGKVEIFGELKGSELTNWIIEQVKSKGGEISRPLADKLGSMVGPDLIKLGNEINKLTTFNPVISQESIDNLIDEGFFESIFLFMDALSEKKPKQAISLLDKFMDNDSNELYLLSMISRQTRNLLQIKDLSKNSSEEEIAKITKLHPFVVKKSLSQARNFELRELLQLHKAVLEADLAFKSSSIDPKVVLTRIVYNFSN